MNYVNIHDIRVKRAIAFVEEEIRLYIKCAPSSFLKTQLEDISWTYYIPALTANDVSERNEIIRKYGSSDRTSIEYYLLYHFCNEFAIFNWASLRSNGVHTRLARQSLPFRHTYLVNDQNEVIDTLLQRCEVPYDYDVKNSEVFNTPHDFYANYFIPLDGRQDWEIALLDQLKALE